jgi:hypothetical protein
MCGGEGNIYERNFDLQITEQVSHAKQTSHTLLKRQRDRVRQTERQIDRETERQTERQTKRQTDRQREREREKKMNSLLCFRYGRKYTKFFA